MSLPTIELSGWNLLGIVAGGATYFMLGAAWYMLLFQKMWLAATGRTEEDFKEGPGPAMLLTLLGSVVSTAVIALVYGWAGGTTVTDGLIVGTVLGVGIAGMEGMKRAVYNFDERAKPWALFAVDGSYAVCGLTLAGAVYAWIA